MKSGLSPLQVHSFDLRVKARASSAEGNETLKLLRAATYGPTVVSEENAAVESIFDPEAQKRDQVTSEDAEASQSQVENMKPTSEQDGSAIAKLPAEDENQQEDQEQLHSVPGDSYAE